MTCKLRLVQLVIRPTDGGTQNRTQIFGSCFGFRFMPLHPVPSLRGLLETIALSKPLRAAVPGLEEKSHPPAAKNPTRPPKIKPASLTKRSDASSDKKRSENKTRPQTSPTRPPKSPEEVPLHTVLDVLKQVALASRAGVISGAHTQPPA